MDSLGTVQTALAVTLCECDGGPFDGEVIELTEFSRSSAVMEITARGKFWRGRYVLKMMDGKLYWRNA